MVASRLGDVGAVQWSGGEAGIGTAESRRAQAVGGAVEDEVG
eukprot:CAMPEP_0198430192 /NCGR_PEP_ID=MMETSP1452-20131203/12133_1 /TAXON_ID=1181717 /ORGANISM="Synchroma pusillum, Strain CCMP3072" /LENGTH=41 /DNA_ID= /DNA_START= /DNA_END= /DNA_ORIENTATION=